MTDKILWNIAVDEPYGVNDSDQHHHDYVYLLYMDDADRERVISLTNGKVSMWGANVCADVDDFLDAWAEHQEDNEP